MNLHEYQAKDLLRKYGLPVPKNVVCSTATEVEQAFSAFEGQPVVVKCQAYTGGRGKVGGVKICKTAEEAGEFASKWLGNRIVTVQTGEKGQPVSRMLVEECSEISRELYLGATIDRSKARVVFMASTEGGMEIEKVAAEAPEKIIKEYIDPAIGLAPFQATRMAYKMNFKPEAIKKASAIMIKLYAAFMGKDCSQVEINPLVVTAENDVICLDAKLNFDDSGLFRHPDIVELRDETEEDPKELWASNEGLNYVNLGGDVACMVNGAGLAMATVDILKYYGGEPANFLDVGGSSTPEKIATAFEIMLDGGQAKGIFVNIFGGINKCDVIAEGIQKAAQIIAEKTGQDGIPVPVVVRLEGTNVERGRQILTEHPVKNVFMAPTMEGGAQDIVKRVEEAKKN